MLLRTLRLGACALLIVICVGCGSGGSGSSSSSTPPPPAANFTVSVNPDQLDLSQSATQTVQVEVVAENGFSGSVSLTAAGLPSGVTASPSMITLSPGTTGTLSLAAASNATSGNASVSITGVSGSLQASTPLSLDVIQTTPPIAVPFATTGGNIIKAFYDESRQLLFATNLGLNEVDVLAGSNLAVQVRIPIGQPFGIDQMPDGNTLVVGTFTQGFYTIDEDTYTVTHYLAPNFSQANSTMVLLIPVTMANGNVLFMGKDIGVGGVDIYIYGAQAIVEWDSTTGQFSMPYYIPYNSLEIDHLKRSADHNWAVYAADKLYIYSSASGSFTSSSNPITSAPYSVRDVAANPNGTQFAVVSAYSVAFYDGSFNALGTASTNETGLTFQWQDAFFSGDGSMLYWELGAGGSIVDVLDTNSFTELGHIISDFSTEPQFEPFLLWVDNAQQAFLAASQGVGVLSCSSPLTDALDFVGAVGANPFVIPLNQSAVVTMNGLPAATSVTFGGQLAPVVSDQNDSYQVQVPASSVAGPVNLVFTQPDGETFSEPLDFVYGVDVAAPTSTLVPPVGNPTLTVFGYGMLNGPSTAPTVSVNGQTVPNVAVDSQANYILQGLFVQLPDGSPGPANITVTSTNGTGTLNAAVTYIPSATILPTTNNLIQVLYDTHRSLLYGLQANQIQVLNPVTLQWQAPMVPGGTGGSDYVAMAITPDGSQMMVLDANAKNITVFNPDNPSQSVSTVLPISAGDVLQSVAATDAGLAFIGTGGFAIQFDLKNNTAKNLQASAKGELVAFVATPDGSHLAGVTENSSLGGVGFWQSSNNSFAEQGISDAFWTDVAISQDGSRVAAVEGAVGEAGVAVAFFDYGMHFIDATVYPDLAPPDQSYCTGALFSASGETFLSPLADSIDFFSTQTATLQGRLLMPELLPVGDLSSGVIALDPNQETIYAISASGLTVVTLPYTVDQVTPFPWPYVARPHAIRSGTGKQSRILDALRAPKEPVRKKTFTGRSDLATSRWQ
jgi:hypothetical protein